ncbi:MAG: 2Fe-2S iron-sulfur cluster-binding protein [Eubacteriales bacterium]|nr:2Fe-2S iron-sulfur cluster-binding protein [Eubacteriales bacterium]
MPSNAELDQPFFFYLDGRRVDAQISADESLFSLLRRLRKYSVKSGCSSSCCGLCTVLVEGEARLSCSIPAHRIHGLEVRTLEGERDEASRFARLLAAEGGEQCGFCSPGFILSVVALKRQQPNANDSEIKARLSGNLCRCTGYQSQMRAIRHYLDMKE